MASKSEIRILTPRKGVITIKQVDPKRPWWAIVIWHTNKEDHQIWYLTGVIRFCPIGFSIPLRAIGPFKSKQAAKDHILKKCLSKGW